MAKKPAPPPYAELHAASAFSFLDGAALPEDLVERAAALELPAVALVDANGVYAAPRFHTAAKQAGVKALVGAELTLDDEPSLFQQRARLGPIGLVPDPKPGVERRGGGTHSPLTPLPASQTGSPKLSRPAPPAAPRRAKSPGRGSRGPRARRAGGRPHPPP